MGILLNGEMFDDGSIDCLNFWIATEENLIQVSSNKIKQMGLEKEVLENKDKGYLSIWPKRNLLYNGFQIMEIQWG